MNRSTLLRAAAVAAAVAATACAREESPPLREASGRALESAIDQQVLVQKAIDARLDRDPEVMRAQDDARREVLAKAWLDRALADRARPTEADVRAFYAANPALFAQRRIYALREIRLSGPVVPLHAVAAAARASASAADAEAAVDRSGLHADTLESTQPAEALPLALLAKLQSMKDGEFAVLDSAGGLVMVELLRSIPAPLAEPQATPVIERFLASRKRVELAREEIARLRGEARIEVPGSAPPAHPPRAASSAVPVNASIQATYDGDPARGIAATALSEEDEQS